MNTFELKPCPFCGGTPVKRRSSGDERDGYADRVSYACPSCGCSQGAIGDTSKGGYADNSKVEEAALAKWNTRTPATTCPGHGRSECVSCCWPKGDGYTAVDMGTAAADGYRDGKANPELQMAHVVRALEKVRGGPVLTSKQCYDLARALNGIQRDLVKS